jgi:hypothetical protein
MTSRRSTVRSHPLGVALVFLAACGSRTPLTLDPPEGTTNVAPGGDPDAEVRSNPDAEFPACFTGTRPVGEIFIDLYFTLDKSRSMGTFLRGSSLTRWNAVAGAMNTFINSPLSAGLGAGITFFPRTSPGGGLYCSTADYAFPVVPIGTLPGTAKSILKAISLQTLASGTPTTPALDGAHLYARSRQVMQPDRAVSVVVVTDGEPHNCNSTIAGTIAVAAAATTGIPPIKTYVLGVGPSLANLNAIAQAGGTTHAYLVESGGEARLLAALETIRTSALACEYILPLTADRKPRIDVVRVTTKIGADGTTTDVEQVPDAEACAGGPGWFFDNPVPPGDPPPTKIMLCPASCTPLVHGTGNQLEVVFGCETAAASP